MYQHTSGPGRKHYVIYTDLQTDKRTESPTFKSKRDANDWIARHVPTMATQAEPVTTYHDGITITNLDGSFIVSRSGFYDHTFATLDDAITRAEHIRAELRAIGA